MITGENKSLNFVKKEDLTGSYRGMRYIFQKEEEQLAVTIYPGPFCFDKTPERKKCKKLFEFTEEGKSQAIDWLNEQYLQKKDVWDHVSMMDEIDS